LIVVAMRKARIDASTKKMAWERSTYFDEEA
jgi:hypothetical protein